MADQPIVVREYTEHALLATLQEEGRTLRWNRLWPIIFPQVFSMTRVLEGKSQRENWGSQHRISER